MSLKPFKILCIILSGGKSQRMKEDKALLPFSSSNSLVEFQYKRLKPYFKDIYISSKIDKFPFLSDKSKIILDEDKEIYSPILALQTILKKFDEAFIITVDTPFISLETIEELIKNSKNQDITIAKTATKSHNLCGVFKRIVLKTIENMIKDDIHKINYLIKNSKHLEIEFSNEDEFLNLNSQTDYQQALKIIN